MAFNHGSKSAFILDDGTGSDRDISGYLSSAGLSRVRDTAETSGLGDTAKEYLYGLQDATIPLEGHWDPTVDNYLNLVYAAATAVPFSYYPAGTASGNIIYSGTCLITSYEITGAVDDRQAISGELQVTGAVTRGTV